MFYIELRLKTQKVAKCDEKACLLIFKLIDNERRGGFESLLNRRSPDNIHYCLLMDLIDTYRLLILYHLF